MLMAKSVLKYILRHAELTPDSHDIPSLMRKTLAAL